ncbi:glutamate-rich WD repeat-containing protein 1 [Latimeria chalumnae]|uniref:glutamate-rich WD repeat-containing protein 1 n=1 Tax=Latimeria chalumnae TaxID=7897 RepID=UPI00313DBED9
MAEREALTWSQNPGDELEEEMESEEEEEEEEEMESEEGKKKVYVPGREALQEGEELVMDERAYLLYHQAQTGSPCLSFDILRDQLGDNRTDYPMMIFLCAGTQAETAQANRLLVLKMHNLHGTKKRNDDSDLESSESEEEEEEEEEEERKPQLELAMAPHYGGINRIRVTQLGETQVAAVWSEKGQVEVYDLREQRAAVSDPQSLAIFLQEGQAKVQPLFTFAGHMTEGFAMDWSPKVPGRLATGDCNKNIHLWNARDGGTWHVDQRPFTGHTKSVEDIQWSPNEATVFASCSVDATIRIWDIRAAPSKACMLTANQAHETDVNVISWNRTEPFLLSGGDDGIIKVWDLRLFKKGSSVARFKQHSGPITSLEWHPSDSSVFAAAGADDQITQWDLAVERDQENETRGSGEDGDSQKETDDDPALSEIPPQLLFIHQGEQDIKEIHWHPQCTGVLISTALSGFNIFRTISV